MLLGKIGLRMPMGARFLRFKRDKRASVALEFGLLALPFALLMFVILESCVSFAAQQFMANATDDLARRIRTGTFTSTNDAGLLDAEICAALRMMVAQGCTGLTTDFRRIENYSEGRLHTFDVVKDKIQLYRDKVSIAPVHQESRSGERYMLRVFYRWPIMIDVLRGRASNFDDASTLLFSGAVWRNEAF